MFHRFSRRPSPALIVSSVALVVALGGAAEASIPDSAGLIDACYAITGGQLRVIDTASTTTCAAGQLSLEWNQAGVTGPTGTTGASGTSRGGRGPAGPRGTAGATGPKGASGSSAAFSTGVTRRQAIGLEAMPLATLALPAGDYAVTAQAQASNDLVSIGKTKAPLSVAFTCYLNSPSTAKTFSHVAATVVSGVARGEAMLPLQALIALPAAGSIELYCSEPANRPGSYASSAVIDAIAVTTVHG